MITPALAAFTVRDLVPVKGKRARHGIASGPHRAGWRAGVAAGGGHGHGARLFIGGDAGEMEPR